MVMSALAVGLGLIAFSPDISWYVGVSGVLFGMFSAGALRVFRRRPLWSAGLLLGMSGILAWSLYAGALPGETLGLGGKVVPQAHLYGALGGMAALLMRLGMPQQWLLAYEDSNEPPHRSRRAVLPRRVQP